MSKLTVMIKAFYENLIYIEDLCAQTKKNPDENKANLPPPLTLQVQFS